MDVYPVTEAKKHEYEVTFLRGKGKDVMFTRWSSDSITAEEEARQGFQWQYGYWPTCPAIVKDTGRVA